MLELTSRVIAVWLIFQLVTRHVRIRRTRRGGSRVIAANCIIFGTSSDPGSRSPPTLSRAEWRDIDPHAQGLLHF